DAEAIGYTLYYATNFVFTGLAVALACHAGLFNIGGEGQATVGGLGATLVALAGDAVLPAPLLIPLAILGAAAFGAGWAAIPGWLQAHRGSHVVVTTIMFNFIAAALMVYLLVNVLIAPGQMSPETRELGPAAQVPAVHALLDGLAVSPLNVSALGALACCAVVWLLLWHTPWGFELRALGHNPAAARYAGIDVARATVLVMAASGALAGLVGVNEILGVHHRLILNFTAGYGFGGIAVALMGRNHPIGVVLASLLFGALTQGGAELAFEIPALSRDMIVVIQGLVILFSGALATMTRPWFEGAAQRLVRKPAVA
ncbi:MAG: ABC transporter permease, partial [Alphaproteobacteria bacterium]|nr:ABC transporter permease [Alphaproteobacteria bacterium]